MAENPFLDLCPRELRLSKYLDDISSARHSLITPKIAERGWSLWLMLSRALPTFDLEVPDAMAGLDGELFLVWDNGIHRFEVNLLEEPTSELIYLGLQSNEDWDSVHQDGEPPPDTAIEKLRLFPRMA